MLSIDAARTIAAATDGGTFDRLTGEPVAPSAGFAVAVPGGAVLDAATRWELVATTIRRLSRDSLAPYIGTWTDRDDRDGECHCRLYIDPVVIVPDRESALTFAAAIGELAVWDFATSSEVRVADQKAA